MVDAGGSGFDFLRLDSCARAASLGGAYTALARDANALHYNPAGLAWLRSREASLTHDEAAEGVSQDFLAYADARGWGIDLTRFDFGRSARTTVANPDGRGLGDAGFTALSLAGGYGRRFGEDLSIGAAIRNLREDIDGAEARAVAADLGVIYSPAEVRGLTLAAAARNMDPWETGERPPLTLRGGSAYTFDWGLQQVTVAADLDKERGDSPSAGIGGEIVIAHTMSVRLGFDARRDAGNGITTGIGWRRGGISADYAFIPLGELGYSNRLSLAVRW